MTDQPPDEREVRLAKHRAKLASGGYPYRFDRTATAAELHEAFPELPPGSESGTRCSIAGRLVLHRSFGKLIFATLQDQTGRIQLMADQAVLGDDALAEFADLDLGDWVGAEGEVVTTRKGELTVRVDRFELLAKALRPLPDKWKGLADKEARYRRRYLDLIVNDEVREVMLARSRVVAALRWAFESRGFVEVETPMLQVRPGGALAKPFVTHLNALDLDMYLRIAPELYLKRLTVAGLERVFEINRNFRNEGIDATHYPEFTMLEAYQAFADRGDMMDLTEAVIADTARSVSGGTVIEYQGRRVDLTPPWPREPLLELVRQSLDIDISYEMPLADLAAVASDLGVEVEPGWGHGKLVDELYHRHIEDGLWGPVFVIDHPVEVSPLARRHRSELHVAERFELYAGGLELGNAFTELNDPLEQRARFEQQARARAVGDEEAHPIDDDYLVALEYGLPPTGGLGIGVDRVVMLLTDQGSIRDVVLFPHLRPEE